MTNNGMPICMAEEYWANSQFSIVRYYGRITINRKMYVIVNTVLTYSHCPPWLQGTERKW